jgi:UDP-GlcNAc3NAcA epimerase
MKFVSIVGARPEFVQTAILSRLLRERHEEVLIHTGQHYDRGMSGRFFEELEIPKPDVDLGVGSLGASAQVGQIMARLAEAIAPLEADAVIVRGDTNSTLAGAIVAKQLLLPLVHVEAGMRSYDRTAPEEINRIAVDHISDLCLTTDASAAARLAGEGIDDAVVVGDVMYDLFLRARTSATTETLPATARRLLDAPFVLLTLHRTENVDDRERLAAIVAGFADAPAPVVFPVHPRTAARLKAFGIALPPEIVAIDPVGYLEMLTLETRARTIFTDSGGVQREAYFAGVPCVTLRDATEWTNTVEAGWNRLAGASTVAIRRCVLDPPTVPASRPALFGTGDAAEKARAALESERFLQLAAGLRATRRRR